MTQRVRAQPKHFGLLSVCSWMLSVVGLGTLLCCFRVMQTRLGSAGGGNDFAFNLGYTSAVAGQLLLILRIGRFWDLISQLVSRVPMRCFFLLGNLAVAVLLLLSVLTQWGAIALMGSWGLLVLVIGLPSGESVATALEGFVRKSPISIGTIYILFVIGEIFFRTNPMLSGGGPAYDQLYAGYYTLNSFGLRNAEISLKPAENMYRIVMLGDSLTFGQGVRTGETYPEQVQSLLNSRKGGRRYEVINAGSCGKNMNFHADRLRKLCLHLDPDLVTVQFYLNDLEPEFEGVDDTINSFLDRVILKPAYKSYVVFFLHAKFERLLEGFPPSSVMSAVSKNAATKSDWTSRYFHSIKNDGPGWLQFKNSVTELGKMSQQHEFPMVMILYPPPARQTPGVAHIHRAVAEQSVQAGLFVIDLNGALAALTKREQIVSDIDPHPSPASHRIAAEKIVKQLRESGWLPSDKSSNQEIDGNQLK